MARAGITPIRPAAAADPIETLLTQILDVNRRMLAALEQPRQVSPMTRADRARLAAILPAIAGALGSEPFASRDLKADDAAPALRVVLKGLTVKSIGRLLARAEGIPIGGLLVERCGVEINVTLWRVVAC
jgi:hypothetical protein